VRQQGAWERVRPSSWDLLSFLQVRCITNKVYYLLEASHCVLGKNCPGLASLCK
jgi:hypothetical protein